MPDYTRASSYALGRLEKELDTHLSYHSLEHTRDVVLPQAVKLAEKTAVSDDGLLLIRTAAVFHDIGFLRQRAEHERAGVVIAKLVLPDFDYTEEQITAISGMIMATRLPQSPNTPLEEIVADADLAILGMSNFLYYNKLLKQEIVHFGEPITDHAWYSGQLQFVRSHSYFTQAAHDFYDEQKAKNIELLERLVAETSPV